MGLTLFLFPACTCAQTLYNQQIVTAIAIINQKGGVGKTTTAANLSAALAAAGKSVCMADLDPQGHLSLYFGHEVDHNHATLYDVLADDVAFADTLVPVRDKLFLSPSTTDLAAAETILAERDDRNLILQKSFALKPPTQDFVIFDCPPSLGLLTINTLSVADEIIIPLQPHFLALQGLAKLLKTIELVQQHLNPKLIVRGILFCMYETVTRLGRDVVEEVRDFFEASRNDDTPWAKARVFQSVIRRNIRLAEAPSHGKTIFEYDAKSNGANDYALLANELLNCYRPTEPS
ncbi:MAG: ParA family protein [Phycisphaerales bacterium]|jgi:chromosome partitioning protein|nr:ParA family protein [Phycisphaerales bacterium]MBT7170575.1 ParA family protein [Phycisphaerales bacterium]